MTMTPVKINGKDFVIVLSHYQTGGALAVQLLEGIGADALPYATISTNLDHAPSPGCFWLKDWSENKEIAAALLSQGVIALTGGRAHSGFVIVKEARFV